jgi:hypothetical protein
VNGAHVSGLEGGGGGGGREGGKEEGRERASERGRERASEGVREDGRGRGELYKGCTVKGVLCIDTSSTGIPSMVAAQVPFSPLQSAAVTPSMCMS